MSSRSQLLDKVWATTSSLKSAMHVHVKRLREALGAAGPWWRQFGARVPPDRPTPGVIARPEQAQRPLGVLHHHGWAPGLRRGVTLGALELAAWSIRTVEAPSSVVSSEGIEYFGVSQSGSFHRATPMAHPGRPATKP